jgi:hypothetical protein
MISTITNAVVTQALASANVVELRPTPGLRQRISAIAAIDRHLVLHDRGGSFRIFGASGFAAAAGLAAAGFEAGGSGGRGSS